MPRGIPKVTRTLLCDCGKERVRVMTGGRLRPQEKCPDCMPGFYRERSLASRERDPVAARDYQFAYRMKSYGLDPDVMRAARTAHDGICESCGDPGDLVDHCHKTLTFRGWLCAPCNKALGLLGDSIPRILALASYLGRHQ